MQAAEVAVQEGVMSFLQEGQAVALLCAKAAQLPAAWAQVALPHPLIVLRQQSLDWLMLACCVLMQQALWQRLVQIL